jgi:parvulin-like peptidyl-prolyl isomerase
MITLMVSLIVLVSGCNGKTALLITPNSTATDALDQKHRHHRQPTHLPPSPTPVPMAAITVNGEGITWQSFRKSSNAAEASQAAAGTDLATNAGEIVLNDLISLALLARAANQQGFILDEAMLQERIAQLTEQAGGEQALIDWQASLGYSPESFQQALMRSIAAAWMRDQIIAAVPETAEQVHARQILLYNSDKASQVYDLLKSGQDFAALATQYSPATNGDLGWFPRGYLTVTALDDIVFNLEPGEYSSVVETPLGFHIIQVIEKESQRLLEPSARMKLQLVALQEWIEQRRSQSQIQILLP